MASKGNKVSFTTKDGKRVSFAAKKKRSKGVLPKDAKRGDTKKIVRNGRELTFKKGEKRWKITANKKAKGSSKGSKGSSKDALGTAKKVQKDRSKRARSMDAKASRNSMAPTSENVRKWAKNPRRNDIRGVDSKGYK